MKLAKFLARVTYLDHFAVTITHHPADSVGWYLNAEHCSLPLQNVPISEGAQSWAGLFTLHTPPFPRYLTGLPTLALPVILRTTRAGLVMVVLLLARRACPYLVSCFPL